MSSIPRIPTAPVPLDWDNKAPGAAHPVFPLGPPIDFPGQIIPNPDNIRPMSDTESPTRLIGAKFSTDNSHGKAPVKTVGDTPPLPKGFKLDSDSTPPLPAGYKLDSDRTEQADTPSAVGRFKDNFLSGLGIGSKEDTKNFFRHPIDTFNNSLKGQAALYEKSKESFKHGDYKGGIIHGLNYLVPFIGQQTDKAGEQLQHGDIAGGMGRTLGVAAPIVAGSPEARGAVINAAKDTAETLGNPTKITAPIRATARVTNNVLKKAPGTIGAAVGGTAGAMTKIPGAAEIGGGIGYGLGKELLPSIKIPGERFGLPAMVKGGPGRGMVPDFEPPTSELPEAFSPIIRKSEIQAPIGSATRPFQVNEPTEPIVPRITQKEVGEQLRGALGYKPLAPNKPIFERPSIKPAAASNELPQGFTPVKSSAVKGFKYSPAQREFEYITKDGQHYVRGDVDDSAVQKFLQTAKEKGSYGKALSELRNNPQGGVGQFKVISGKRVPVIKAKESLSGEEEPDVRTLRPDEDMTETLKSSLRNVTNLPKDVNGNPVRYAYRAREVGEKGVPLRNTHASATSSEAQALKYAEAGQRSPEQGQVVKIDLSKLSPEDYVVKEHPDGALWIQFTRPLTESEVEHYTGTGKSMSKK